MDFTAKEISTIIRSCRDTGVREFSCGELKLTFTSTENASPQIAQTLIGTGLSQEVHQTIENEIDLDEDLQEIELQTLMIEDPMAYERAMRWQGGEGSGEIEQPLPRG